MSCGFRHAPGAAGGAKPALFARKRHNMFCLAVPALQAQEAVGQDATAQVSLELRPHIVWQRTILGLPFHNEGTQVILQDLVTGGEFGTAANVSRSCAWRSRHSPVLTPKPGGGGSDISDTRVMTGSDGF